MSRPNIRVVIKRQHVTVRTGPRALGGGGSGAVRFVWTQPTPAAQWLITHSLPEVSHVSFFALDGRSFTATWREVSATQIETQIFASAIGGKAHLS